MSVKIGPYRLERRYGDICVAKLEELRILLIGGAADYIEYVNKDHGIIYNCYKNYRWGRDESIRIATNQVIAAADDINKIKKLDGKYNTELIAPIVFETDRSFKWVFNPNKWVEYGFDLKKIKHLLIEVFVNNYAIAEFYYHAILSEDTIFSFNCWNYTCLQTIVLGRYSFITNDLKYFSPNVIEGCGVCHYIENYNYVFDIINKLTDEHRVKIIYLLIQNDSFCNLYKTSCIFNNKEYGKKLSEVEWRELLPEKQYWLDKLQYLKETSRFFKIDIEQEAS